jgi:eukaryotic-like serine/threonine-protein kinase
MSVTEEWRALEPYLDQALRLTKAQRKHWLLAVGESDGELANRLRGLLETYEQLKTDNFLNERPSSARSLGGLTGHEIGGYTLLSEIGHGGMGTVWLAERTDQVFTRKVAIKLLNFSLAGTAGEGRFRREGRILAKLKHPYIANLLSAGVSPAGQPYLVLDYIEGKHIDTYCEEHRLDIRARLVLFLDVLSAVAHAHKRSIVHRDIKPSNVLVDRNGKVQLVDFGISKMLSDADNLSSSITRPALTLRYASPEQLTNGSVTVTTDVYALGVLLYVLLTGRHPAGAALTCPADLVKSIVQEKPLLASEAVRKTARQSNENAEDLARQLHGNLDAIVGKALRKKQRERYASATAFADDLKRHLRKELVLARCDTLMDQISNFLDNLCRF